MQGQLWGLGDQALVSITSFTTLVALARVLGPDEFGSFTLVYTALLIVNTLQTALITQPHNVLGVRQSPPVYGVYTGSTLVTQLVFTAVVVAAGSVAAAVAALVGSELTELLVAFVPATLAWQLQEFARRILYTEGRLHAAFANDVVAYGGQIVLLVLLWQLNALDGQAALYALAATSAGGAILGAWQLRRSIVLAFDAAAARANWRFGKWSGGATIAFILSSHLYTYLAAVIVGAFAAGVLKAAQLLFGPLNVLVIFLNNVLPIRLARAYAAGGEARLGRGLTVAYVLTLPVVTVYCLVVGVFATDLLDLVYGAQYAGYEVLVALLGVYYFVNYVGQLVSNALYAKETPRPVFIGHWAGALAGVGLGWLLIDTLGVDGAAVAMILSSVCVNVVVWWAYAIPRVRGASATSW